MNTAEMQETIAFEPESKIARQPKEKEANGKPEESKKDEIATPKFGGGSFSTYYTWRGHGMVKLNCGHGSINANSRVVASVSEYNTDPRLNRFVGDAYLFVYSVSPYNGGVIVRFNVGWNNDLNVRVDLFIDP